MKTFNWSPAPLKIQFGEDIVILDIAIDKDHTLTLYCEKEMIPKVNEMLKSVPEYEDC